MKHILKRIDGTIIAESNDGTFIELVEKEKNNLYDANLRGADLYDADLKNSDLRGADLFGADLSYANLESADLEGANLTDANLTGVTLTNVNLTDTTILRTKFHNIIGTRITLPIGYKKVTNKNSKQFKKKRNCHFNFDSKNRTW